MSQDFERLAKMALDAEQQWKRDTERTSQEAKATKFHNTFAPTLSDFEKFQAMECAQNQAPLDMVAELKTIHERIDKHQSESSKESQASRRREWITITIGLLTLIATVLIGILK